MQSLKYVPQVSLAGSSWSLIGCLWPSVGLLLWCIWQFGRFHVLGPFTNNNYCNILRLIQVTTCEIGSSFTSAICEFSQCCVLQSPGEVWTKIPVIRARSFFKAPPALWEKKCKKLTEIISQKWKIGCVGMYIVNLHWSRNCTPYKSMLKSGHNKRRLDGYTTFFNS